MFSSIEVRVAILFILGGLLSNAAFASDRYQQELFVRTQGSRGLTIESTPDGKKIEKIVVVPYDVVAELDPWPEMLNWFHMKSLEDVVARELLFKEGDVWEQKLVEESGRNLRNNLYLSVAQIIPCVGSSPDQIIALVVTKDYWSLVINTDFSIVGSRIEKLEMQLAELNLLGKNKRMGVGFIYDLATLSFDTNFKDPRVMGTHYAFTEDSAITTNRNTGKVEGGSVNLGIERPLFSLSTPLSWSLTTNYRNDFLRLFSNGAVGSYTSPQTGESLPYSYHRRELDTKFKVTRSLGYDVKHNFSVGWRGISKRYSLPDNTPSLMQATVDDFTQQVLPVTENDGIIFLSYETYRAEFVQFVDIDRYGLTEDFRLGPSLTLDLNFAHPAFGYVSRFFQPVANLTSTWNLNDDLLTVSASLGARYQTSVIPDVDWVNRVAVFQVRNVSPRWGGFRLHTAGRLSSRERDLNRTVVSLGGDGALRGYPSGYLRGNESWGVNLELRTEPVLFYTLHFGGIYFVDMGDAFSDWSKAGIHASTGLGIRALYPQFNRVVMRVDFGIPLERINGGTASYLAIRFGQAF